MIRHDERMTELAYALIAVLMLSSVSVILTVLLHKGSGGGLSGMFGGTPSAVAAASAVAAKNLTRITITSAIIWVAAVTAYGLLIHALT